jgi:CTP-dependent riboflavin kinase
MKMRKRKLYIKKKYQGFGRGKYYLQTLRYKKDIEFAIFFGMPEW